MLKWIRGWYVEITGLLVLAAFLYFILSGVETLRQLEWLNQSPLPYVPPKLQSLSILFLSIFIEGLPFILAGVFISSLIHVYIREETVWRWVPKTPWVAIPFATAMGLFLPVCECGIVPVARRLIQKGLPAYIAFTFLLAAPVINPVTIASTYFAFGNSWDMAMSRILLAAGIAALMGLLFYFFFSGNVVKEERDPPANHSHACEHSGGPGDPAAGDGHGHGQTPCTQPPGDRLVHAMYHSVFEFMDMGKYFVAGALIAASFQTFVGMSAIRDFAENEWLAIGIMMGLAFGLSLCSSADAFVAASFRTALTTPALLAFMVYGPMMDLKNLLMMWGSFRRSVIVFFFTGTTVLTLTSLLLFFT